MTKRLIMNLVWSNKTKADQIRFYDFQKVMDMMRANEKQIHNREQVKAFFFDFLVSQERAVEDSTLYQTLISRLHVLFLTSCVRLYLFDKWEEHYYLVCSTDANVKPEILDIAPSYEGAITEKRKYIDGHLHHVYTVPIKDFEAARIVGWFEFEVIEENVTQALIHELEIVSNEGSHLFKMLSCYYQSHTEDLRYKQLYRTTTKLHSLMDTDDVLYEIIETLKEVYPFFNYRLHLSHDSKHDEGLPIKGLKFGAKSTAANVYLTGESLFDDETTCLYAPLKGRQGVYGVLEVSANHSSTLRRERGFIELIASTAGSAIENAQLYQQSKRLITDLQLINKTSHRLNSYLRLADSIQFMCEQIANSFHADEVGFIIFTDDGSYKVLQGSSHYFTKETTKGLLDSLNALIKKEEESLFIGDMQAEQEISENPFRALMAIPMVQSGALMGAAYVIHSKPYFFSFEDYKLLQSLIHHSTLAFTNSMLREELEYLVVTDHLTKLYSRKYLDEKIQESMKNDRFGVFILIDIDNFKMINDTYGHQIGDEVIIQVSDIIRGNIREVDIGARWGGEELAVYLPKVTFESGVKIAERLVANVATMTDPKITISCGVAFWDRETEQSVKKLFNCADEALYQAKNSGKNCVVIWDGKK